MEKIFIQFYQWIVKHRKKIIYGAFILVVSQFCFFKLGGIWIGSNVFAADLNQDEQKKQEQTQTINETFSKWKSTMSFFNKACNIFIYPMLVVAWYLVDNSFVYWEVFGFDAVLWQLWNIVKNLANFTLWFYFVYKIFKYLIGDGKEKIKDVLLSALIAWIWIQASWFIMAALIDVSTILTYGVWWLPISVLGGDSKKNDNNLESNPYIMKSLISVDAKDIDNLWYFAHW